MQNLMSGAVATVLAVCVDAGYIIMTDGTTEFQNGSHADCPGITVMVMCHGWL